MVVNWFKDNKIIVNPGKFQAVILDQKKNNHTQEMIKLDKNAAKIKSSVKLLGVQIDAGLNFNLHIVSINALIRLRKF